MNKKSLLFIFICALIAFLWANYVGYAIYYSSLLMGEPEWSAAIGNLHMSIISFLFGLLIFATSWLKLNNINRRLALQAIVVIMLVLALPNIYFSGIVGITSQLKSYGFWSFMLGCAFVLTIKVKYAK